MDGLLDSTIGIGKIDLENMKNTHGKADRLEAALILPSRAGTAETKRRGRASQLHLLNNGLQVLRQYSSVSSPRHTASTAAMVPNAPVTVKASENEPTSR